MISAETKTYTTERLGAHNIAHLQVLHAAVYGRALPNNYFLNKYNTAYTGTSNIGFIAYNQRHQPIGFYGVIPTALWCNNKVLLAAQSADTMTHPDYRNMGLFTELANQTYELCKSENIELVFGFPNQNSLPGFVKKLSWYVNQTMDRFTIPVKAIVPVEKIANKYVALLPFYQTYQNLILKKYIKSQSGFAGSILPEGFDGVLRNDDYLNYKTYSPTTVIQINKTLFWLKLTNGLHIGDIKNAGSDFEQTMQKLKIIAGRLGINAIHFQTSPQTKLHALFSKYYQAEPSYHVGFKYINNEIDTQKIKFTFADIDIF